MDVLQLTCRAPHAPTTSFKAGCDLYPALKSTALSRVKRRCCSASSLIRYFPVKATADGSRETVDGRAERDASRIGAGGFTGSAMEVTTFNQSFGDASDFPAWEKIGALVRLSYGVEEIDVKGEVMGICNLKSTGPDGFESCFYKHRWSYLKEEGVKH